MNDNVNPDTQCALHTSHVTGLNSSYAKGARQVRPNDRLAENIQKGCSFWFLFVKRMFVFWYLLFVSFLSPTIAWTNDKVIKNFDKTQQTCTHKQTGSACNRSMYSFYSSNRQYLSRNISLNVYLQLKQPNPAFLESHFVCSVLLVNWQVQS